MGRDYDAAGGRFPLLQPADRWRDRFGSVDHDFLRIGLAEQWNRDSGAGSGRKLLSRTECAARSRERAMVFFYDYQQVAPMLRLHAAGLWDERQRHLPRSVFAPRLGRR